MNIMEKGYASDDQPKSSETNIQPEAKDAIKTVERVIPKEFFDDPSNKFLYDTAVSELSSPELTSGKEKYINRFLDLLTNPPKNSKEKEKYEDESLVDREATEALTSKLDGLLKETREEIGIPPGKEKPFKVKVLRLKSEYYFDQEEEWEKLTGAPSMVMNRDLSIDNEPENSTIYLSHVHFEKMFNDGGWEQFKMGEFLHEYRHTQRSFSFADSHLYRFIDEVCTNKAVGYTGLTTALDILCSSTKNMKFEEFFKAYESGDKNLKTECLEKFKENFSGLGLMLLGGKKSSEHAGDNDGKKTSHTKKNMKMRI